LTKADPAHNFIPVNEALSPFYLRLASALSLLLLTTALGCGSVEKNQPSIPQSSPTTPPVTKPAPRMSITAPVSNASPLILYDRALIEKIRNHWHLVMDGTYLPNQVKAKVTLTFRLHADGQISELMVTENTGNAIQAALSQKAIEQSAPFPPWSAEVRKEVGKDHRETSFTFHYQ